LPLPATAIGQWSSISGGSDGRPVVAIAPPTTAAFGGHRSASWQAAIGSNGG